VQTLIFGSGCIGSEGSPPVGSRTKNLVRVSGTNLSKRESGDLGKSPPKAEAFCANVTIFCIAVQFAENDAVLRCSCTSQVVSLLIRSKLEF